MERMIALYDSDSFYATRFMEYFKKRKEYNYEFSAFTRLDSLEEYLTTHKIEILLLGSTGLAERSLQNVKYVYHLSDSPNTEEISGSTSVYKFQPANALMNEILNDYNRRENLVLVNNSCRQHRTISVFSQVQSAEAATFAWSLGIQLSELKKVLLVIMDPLSVPVVAFADYSKLSLSEFIFYLKENSNSILKMKSLLEYSSNLAYLAGISHTCDLLSMTKEDIRKWSEELQLYTDYHYVVFFLCTYNEATEEIMKGSDTVFVTVTGSSFEEKVYSVWVQQMERSGIEVAKGKFVRTVLREEDTGQIPYSNSALRNSASWNSAKQCMKIID